MDQLVTLTQGRPALTQETVTDLRNLVYTSIVIERGHWWFNPAFGSRLHELRRAKATERTARLAREYAREALQWLQDTGRATAIDVATDWQTTGDGSRRLYLTAAVTPKHGPAVSFDIFVEVV